MKKVLITGALGQDGKILSKIYLKNNFKVYGLIKNRKKEKIEKVIYIKNNLSSKIKTTKIINKIKPNIILHLAASNNSYSSRNKDTYSKIYKGNVLISKNLIDSIICSKIKCKFIFAGSSLMFGINKKNVNERTPFKSNEYYGKYKIEIHKYLEKLSLINKINFTTVILFNHDSYFRNQKFLIPRIIKAFKIKNKKFIENIYSLNISGDFSSAYDICLGIYKLSISKFKIKKIILSSSKRFYLNDFLIFLEKKYKLGFFKARITSKNNKKFLGSNSLARKTINFRTRANYLLFLKTMLKSK